jgi:predicted dehydrogenase
MAVHEWPATTSSSCPALPALLTRPGISVRLSHPCRLRGTIAAMRSAAPSRPCEEALLDQATVNAVIVATPHHLLCSVTLAALRVDKHVLAESPSPLMSTRRR